MAERKKLELISSVEIMNTPMKKQRFIVDGMIYPGLHILSGDPKIGKSWMMLDMCLAVAKGESFLGRKTEQGQVVYMALEDTFVSLQSRMYELTDEPSENLSFALILDSKDRYHYVIDPFGAELVKRIFGMRCDGMSILAIAKKMNDEGVITPRDYWYQLQGKENPRNITHKWTDVSVGQILRNEAYIGNMVQNKQGHMSYKNKKIIAKQPEEHIRVEGTHEPIIDMETWEAVRKMDSKKKFRSGKDKKPSMFSGLLKCADCGMALKISKDMRPKADGRSRDLHSYICRTYSNGGKSACTSHRIREPVLIEIVRQNLAQYIQKLKYSESELRKELMSRKDSNDIKSVKQQLTYSNKRIAELDKLIENLYVDKVNGTIPQSAFDRLIQKYEAEHAELEERVDALKISVEDTAKAKDDVDQWIEIMKGYMKNGEIDRPLLISLIDTITVGEVREENGEKVRDIKIKYNFVGEI